ncbi:hypothetical protein D3C83_127460 [compost metagenome]
MQRELLVCIEFGAQKVGEEVVIAVPLALMVERNEKEIGALQMIEYAGAVVASGDGIAQRRVKTVENRRPPQEGAGLGRLLP